MKGLWDINQSDEMMELTLSQNTFDIIYQFNHLGFKLNTNYEEHPSNDIILEKLNNEKEEAEEKLNQVMKEYDTFNREIRSQEIIIEDLKNEKSEIEEKMNQILVKLHSSKEHIQAKVYETNYYDDIDRPLIQRLISKFPSLYLIFSGKNKGPKNILLNIKGYNAIKKNNLFDLGYYLRNNDDVRISGKDPLLHYICHGYKECRNPSITFDGDYYIKKHKDIKNSNLNPLVHYSLYGINEGRKVR